MIEIKTEGNSVICILKGVLDGSKPIDISIIDLSNKKIQIIGEDITSWTTDFAVELFNILRSVPKENISYSHLPEGMEQLLRLALQVPFKQNEPSLEENSFLENIGQWGITFFNSAKKGLRFIYECITSWGRQLTGNAVYRSKDFWLILSDCGPKSILIVSLISFMVGLILAFVGAIQLKTFGAQIYVASLVTIGMTRIMGAVMTGIIT